MDNLWTNLTSLPLAEDTFSLPVVLFLVVFVLGFLMCVVIINRGARRRNEHPIARRAIQHCANIGMYVFGAGVFFVGIRALQINPFSFGGPLWLWLSLVAVAVWVAYCARYLRVTYPANLKLYEERQLKAKYLKPTPAQHRRGPTIVRPSGAGKPPRNAAAAPTTAAAKPSATADGANR